MAAAELATEARYVTADGTAVTTTLGALSGATLVTGLPVRQVRSHAGSRHYTGLFWSATTGRHVPYESRLELDRLWLADFDPSVVAVVTQPVWLVGQDGPATRRHVPDVLLQHRDGGFTVVDVKPGQFASRPEVAQVFAWTARVCASKGWRYEVWTGAPPVLMANVRWLGMARRREFLHEAALEVARAAAAPGRTIGQVVAGASEQVPEALVRPAVLWLLWSGAWVTELSRPLSQDSVLAPGTVGS